MNAKQLEKILFNDGWYLANQAGSHRHYKHPVKSGKVPYLFTEPKICILKQR